MPTRSTARTIKHNMVAFLKKPNESVGFTEVVDFLKGAICGSRINSLEKELKETTGDTRNVVLQIIGSRREISPPIWRQAKTLSKLLLRVLARKNQLIRARDTGEISSLWLKRLISGLDAEEEINTQVERVQREGKAPMVEEDIQATHKTKEQIRQEEAGLEEAIKTTKEKKSSGEKVAEVKEEEQVKRTGKRKKQKARKGINVNKSAQEDSETNKEESVEAYETYSFELQNLICVNWKIISASTKKSIEQIGLKMLMTECFGVISGLCFDPPLNEDAILELTTITKDDGKMNEVCYKLLKMIEKQAGIRKLIDVINEAVGIFFGN
ncbi:hypothetical protein Tco_1132850 [Tanacetum coccineum]|uniref:Uncharacterized protein n=1 Tax=Tanacetum coccineum TaxID=301880 RepID=A0ABQ5JH54_9ASTR